MSRPTQAKFQIGKNGITEGVIESLTLAFKYRKQVRVSVLKSTGRDKTKMHDLAKELLEKLPFKLNHRIIGFTIILIKTNQAKTL